MKKGKREKLSAIDELSLGMNRVKARCRYFGECGGCLMQDIGYKDQVELKRQLVNRAFEKHEIIARLEKDAITYSPEQWFYRNRMDYPVGENEEIGLKPFGKWRDVLDLKECFLLSKKTPEILQLVRDWMRTYNLKGWNNVRYHGFVRYVVIREGKRTGERMIMIVTSGDDHDPAIWPELVRRLKSSCTTLYHGVNPTITDISIPQDMRLLMGPEFLSEKINGYTYKIFPSSFFQTNSDGAELLQQRVRAQVKGTRVLDLYCGLGFFTIDFAAQGKKTFGVELDAAAIELARENAKLNNVEADFAAASMEEWIRGDGPAIVKDFAADSIVVDPPRMGLHPRVVDWLKDQKVPELVYISCNYEQLAKEMLELQKVYKLVSLEAVDMFPNTPHIETIARFIPKQQDFLKKTVYTVENQFLFSILICLEEFRCCE